MAKCSVVNQVKAPNCTPNVGVSQYKNPCGVLPLDGPKHNNYPLSNNPPKTGGKKKYRRKSSTSKLRKSKSKSKSKSKPSKFNRRIFRTKRRSLKGGK